MGKNKIKHKLLVILTCTIVCSAIGSVIGNFALTPKYVTTSRYYIKKENNQDSDNKNKKENIKDYIYFLSSDDFINRIIIDSGLSYSAKEMKKMIKLDPIKNTYFFDISVSSESASDAYQLQHSIDKIKTEYIKENVNKISGDKFTIGIVDEADFPESPSSKNIITLTLAFALIGLASGVALAFLGKNNSKDEYQTADSVLNNANTYDYPTLAKIPPCTSVQKNKTVIVNTGSTDFDNAFITLYSEIKYESDNPCNIVTVCSPENGDGKTTTAVNLAISAAGDNMRVLLLDCNFRNSNIHKYFRMQIGQPGFSNIIQREIIPENAIITTPYDSLFVLPPGTSDDNPLLLLTNSQTPDIINKLRSMFDYIIVDTPAINDVSDALTMAQFTDTLLLVIKENDNDRDSVEKAIKSFELSSKKKITGLVLNNTDIPKTNESRKKEKKNRFVNYEI